MKLNDIIKESHELTEAPVGMLKRAGLGLASKLGSAKAAGALDTGAEANALRKAYDRYLGQTGQTPNSDNILVFLSKNGLPTGGAQSAIQAAGDAAGVPIGQRAKDFMNKFTKSDPKQDDGQAAQQDKQEPSLDAEPAAQEPAADNATQEPAMGKEQPAAQEPTDGPAPAAGKPNVSYSKSTGFDPATMKNKSEPLGPDVVGGIPDTTDPLSRIKSLAGVGGGQQQAEPAKTKKPKKEPAPAESIQEDATPLKSGTVDKIILAAVQDAIKSGYGQKLSAVASGGGGGAADDAGDDEQGSGQSAFGAFKQGVQRGLGQAGGQGGQMSGNLNVNQLAELLPNVDAQALKRALALTIKGQQLNREQTAVMAQAFQEIIKLDPQGKTKVLSLLKAVRN